MFSYNYLPKIRFFAITGSLDHTEFRIDNEMHRVKIGAPTRELWIDGAWYSVFFDCRPVSIKIGSRSWDVFLEDGAAPIVDIGKVARKDLCLGIIIRDLTIILIKYQYTYQVSVY